MWSGADVARSSGLARTVRRLVAAGCCVRGVGKACCGTGSGEGITGRTVWCSAGGITGIGFGDCWGPSQSATAAARTWTTPQ